jgi:hypothetical protein
VAQPFEIETTPSPAAALNGGSERVSLCNPENPEVKWQVREIT